MRDVGCVTARGPKMHKKIANIFKRTNKRKQKWATNLFLFSKIINFTSEFRQDSKQRRFGRFAASKKRY